MPIYVKKPDSVLNLRSIGQLMNFPDRIGYLPGIAIHTNTIITTFGPLKYTRSLGYGGGIYIA